MAPGQAVLADSRVLTLIIKLQRLIIIRRVGEKAQSNKMYHYCFLMLLVDHYWQDTANRSVSFSREPVFIISKEKIHGKKQLILC